MAIANARYKKHFLIANQSKRIPNETRIPWRIGFESKVRAEYLAAVKKADSGDLPDLIELHRDCLSNNGIA